MDERSPGNIAKNLKMLRKKSGLKAYEVANMAGITPAAVSQIEKGKRIPSLPVAVSLSRVFAITIDDLMKLGE